MERFGLIHDKLDLKILILYVLSRLPDFIDREELSELVLLDEGVGYFDFTQCLAELQDTEHVERKGSDFRVTEKGRKNCAAVESSLPYTMRVKVDKAIVPVVRTMNRNSMIRTSHERLPEGGCMVEMSMGDGVGDVISLRLLAAGEEQAEKMEAKFRAEAETFYSRIMEILSEE